MLNYYKYYLDSHFVTHRKGILDFFYIFLTKISFLGLASGVDFTNILCTQIPKAQKRLMA